MRQTENKQSPRISTCNWTSETAAPLSRSPVKTYKNASPRGGPSPHGARRHRTGTLNRHAQPSARVPSRNPANFPPLETQGQRERSRSCTRRNPAHQDRSASGRRESRSRSARRGSRNGRKTSRSCERVKWADVVMNPKQGTSPPKQHKTAMQALQEENAELKAEIRRLNQRLEEAYIQNVIASAERTTRPESGQQDAWQKAALFYQSCRAVVAGGDNKLETVKSLLRDSSVFWPEFNASSNLLRMLLSLSATYDWAAVIHFKLVRHKAITVFPAKFYGMVMDRRSAAHRDNITMKLQRQYFKDITARLGEPGTAELSFDELFSLETRVVLALQTAYNTPMGSATLFNQSLDDVIDLANSSIPKSTWQEELYVQFEMALSGSEPVFTIRNLHFFSAFFNLTQSEGESNMTYYVGWVVVQGLLLLENKYVNGYYLDQADADRHRALFCVNLTHEYMGRAFYVGFLRQELRPPVLKNVSRLVRAVRTGFHERLTSSPWASASPHNVLTANSSAIDSRDPSLTILAETLHSDGLFKRYPNMNETKIFGNMKGATAAYRITDGDTTMPDILYNGTVRFSEIGHDSFHLLPVALGLPFFNMEAPLAVSYGILGNEVSNALATVLFRRMRLATDETSLEELRKAIRCFTKKSSAPSTAGMTDDAGLELARAALSVRVLFGVFQEATKGRTPWTLSILPSSTQEQLFFRFWCFSLCGGSTAKLWCNEPLKSFHRFSEVFSCKFGSAMSTVKDCAALEWFL
ncbi:hypothetical protein HPB48_001035 [Haemaphysalis longicornis]|uniref:Peptidase M13 N-terminal domain-containing protein n=1 Tax=Haemaphysalis longicornis TaxID=44386 RepID=A0A9J6G073_HAELO|nr:hypothetical protein HPB48_001035 [Haemaphysalis longicornis]